MPHLLQVGSCTSTEIHDDLGHVAATLAGVNLESRAGVGCVMGDAARGARNQLFPHRFHRVLSDAATRRALDYALSCVGQPYVLGQVPTPLHGGDSSGLLSGIVCHALGRDPVRLFTTQAWPDVRTGLGFVKGLGGGGVIGGQVSDRGRPDRPYPGRTFGPGQPACGHVAWVQARLNFDADGRHAELEGRALVEDGEYDAATEIAVRAFQRARGIEADGQVGRRTWAALNALR